MPAIARKHLHRQPHGAILGQRQRNKRAGGGDFSCHEHPHFRYRRAGRQSTFGILASMLSGKPFFRRRHGLAPDGGTMALELNTVFDPRHGEAVEVAQGVLRVTAPNPSPFTFHGTNSYIVGTRLAGRHRPGPGRRLRILPPCCAPSPAGPSATSWSATPTATTRRWRRALAERTGATVLAEGPYRPARAIRIGEANRLDAANDMDFRPDHALVGSRGDRWRRMGASRGPDARPRRQSRRLRAGRNRNPILRRSCHGMVDNDRGAARRRDVGLYGLARPPSRTRRPPVPARPWRLR